MGTLLTPEPDTALTDAAIDALAAEMRRPAAEVRSRYLHEYQRLENGARIRDFLSVCAVRHVRDTLRSAAR